jgi:sn-glycerol 3-phosphate transport system permease protein
MVTNVNEMRTVQVIITMLNASELNSVYGQVMAAAIMILIPSVVIFALFQRKITAGMMAGAVKE